VDLVFNLGLFSLMRGLSIAAGAALEARGLAALRGPAQLVISVPVLQGYGLVRFRIEEGRWPTDSELDRMTIDNVIMTAALAVAMRPVERIISQAQSRNTPLARFHRTYGWRFATLEAGRGALAEQLRQLVRQGDVADPVKVQDLRSRAERLEAELRTLLDEVRADKSVDLEGIRAELRRVRQQALEGTGELLERALNMPADVRLRRAGGEREYTYEWGTSSQVKRALEAIGGRVTVAEPDAVTGSRTITVTFAEGDVPLTFQERSAPYPARGEVDVNPADPAILNLLTEFSINDPAAGREVIRMLQVELAKHPDHGLTGPVRVVRRALNALRAADPTVSVEDQVRLAARRGRVEQQLQEDVRQGRLTSGSAARILSAARTLDADGLLSSPEWLAARDPNTFTGVVGERLATRDALAAAGSGARVLRNVRFIGRLFDDPAGATPHLDSRTGRAGPTDVASELDLLIGADSGGTFEFRRASNVKIVQPGGAAAIEQQARAQSQEALDAMQAHSAGRMFQRADGTWARVDSVTAIDASTGQRVDLTGRVRPAAAVDPPDTVGPAQPARGRGDTAAWSRRIGFTAREIESIVDLLRERQAMRSPGW
jgi:hypothetical protein